MINFTDYAETYTHRAAGWVQDAASFENLHYFVSAFSHHSVYRNELIDKIQRLVQADLATKFTKALDQKVITLMYQDIVGLSPRGSRRSNTVCNGIGQAALKGQKREFQGDWSTNNFLRWAEALQFIKCSPSTDSYAITEVGEAYVQTVDIKEQYKIIRKQLIMYPPAIRVLTLIDSAAHTKFSLGERLGFIGEKGFTNISEKLFVDIYFATESTEEKKKLRRDHEGSSDKYARQICSWLVTLGLAETITKEFSYNGEVLGLKSYKSNAHGREFLRKARIAKRRFVPFGMLSMEDSNKELICKRRALILKTLSKSHVSIKDIIDIEKEHGIDTVESEINDDILSLQNMGLAIVARSTRKYALEDTIEGLEIPRRLASLSHSEALKVKEKLRKELKYVDHNLLVLIDFAYGSNRTSRLLEVYVAKVYEQVYPRTFSLGGASKPDIVVCSNEFVMIIDTKAYAQGFSLPQGERDKMVRYIEEYKQKECAWYKRIEDAIKTDVPVFQFVSSGFSNVEVKLADITKRTGIRGSVISAEHLLRTVEYMLANKASLDLSMLVSNKQIISASIY